jgi:hypothetical protein
VSDGAGATRSAQVTIQEPVELAAAAIQPPSAFGCGDECGSCRDGSATVLVEGDNGPFNYRWDDPLQQTTPTATGLATGDYTVTVTDRLGCRSRLEVSIPVPDCAFCPVGDVQSARFVLPLLSCPSATELVGMYITHPTLREEYMTHPTLRGACEPAPARVLGARVESCQPDMDSAVVDVAVCCPPPPSSLAVTPDVGMEYACDREGGYRRPVTLEIRGGTPPYRCTAASDDTYSQEPQEPSGNQCQKLVSPGQETFTVTDAVGATESVQVTIEEPEKELIALSVAEIKSPSAFGCGRMCGCRDGSVTVAIEGEKGPFYYRWNDPLEQDKPDTMGPAVATGLAAGKYTVTVTDKNGCRNTLDVAVPAPSECVAGPIEGPPAGVESRPGPATFEPAGTVVAEPECWQAPARPTTSPLWRAARRADAAGKPHLLLTVDAGHERPIDEVRLSLPKKAVKDAAPAHLPPGWSMDRQREALVLRGPATPPPLYLKLDVGGRVPAKVEYRVFAAGEEITRREDAVAELPPVAPRNSVQGLVVLPPQVSAGETVQFRAVDPSLTPPSGEWTIAGQVLEPIDAAGVPCGKDPAGRGIFQFTIPPAWQSGQPVPVTFDDPWGDTVAKDPDPGMEVKPPRFEDTNGDGVWNPGEPLLDQDGPPTINEASPFASPGGQACVCGNFADFESRSGVLVDGRLLGPPLTASNTVVWLELPPNLPLGRHTISGWRGAGFSPEVSHQLDIVRVEGSLDQQQLFSGGATEMQLRVTGTQQPVPIRLRNHTPAIVTLDGGPDQVLTTSGGENNQARQTVRAVARGAFNIQWQLPECPCSAPTGYY